MISKKALKSVLTVLLIGTAGILYCFSSNSNTDAGIVLSDDVEEREFLQDSNGKEKQKTETAELDQDASGSQSLSQGDQESKNMDSVETQVKGLSDGDLTEQEDQQVGGQAVVTETLVVVHVCGQVRDAGVYEMPKDSRVSDAIEAAGGLTKLAAGDAINQAEKLSDGQRIYIPSLEEYEASAEPYTQTGNKESGTGQQVASQLVNINKATKEELMTLPGIGESKADMIIAYRNEHGAFAKIEDIKNITGIKDGVFQKICDLITTD